MISHLFNGGRVVRSVFFQGLALGYVFLLGACDEKLQAESARVVVPALVPATAEEPALPKVPPALNAALAVDLYEALAEAHQREKVETCASLAARLRNFRAEKREVFEQIEAATWIMIEADEALKTRAQTAFEVIMTESMRCKTDPAMQALKLAPDATDVDAL